MLKRNNHADLWPGRDVVLFPPVHMTNEIRHRDFCNRFLILGGAKICLSHANFCFVGDRQIMRLIGTRRVPVLLSNCG